MEVDSHESPVTDSSGLSRETTSPSRRRALSSTSESEELQLEVSEEDKMVEEKEGKKAKVKRPSKSSPHSRKKKTGGASGASSGAPTSKRAKKRQAQKARRTARREADQEARAASKEEPRQRGSRTGQETRAKECRRNNSSSRRRSLSPASRPKQRLTLSQRWANSSAQEEDFRRRPDSYWARKERDRKLQEEKELGRKEAQLLFWLKAAPPLAWQGGALHRAMEAAGWSHFHPSGTT